MRRFEYVQGTSAKFWMATAEGVTFTVVFGRLGTEGQRKDKAFPSEDGARRELEKKIAEKLREGYHEVAAAAPVARWGQRGGSGGAPHGAATAGAGGGAKGRECAKGDGGAAGAE